VVSRQRGVPAMKMSTAEGNAEVQHDKANAAEGESGPIVYATVVLPMQGSSLQQQVRRQGNAQPGRGQCSKQAGSGML